MRGFKRHGKTIWTMDSEPAFFFAIKQLQYNILKTFKVKQSSRFDIVKQLRVLLEDGFPKYVIRIDVKGFYESIPQGILFKRIEENQLLNFQSKKLLKQCIYCYENMKDLMIYKEHHGVPRGIGVSAYLFKLYMREIDSRLKSIKDLVYFGRYVDDIVLVFIPESEFNLRKRDYYKEIKDIVTADGLNLKDGSDGGLDKTLKLDLFSPLCQLFKKKSHTCKADFRNEGKQGGSANRLPFLVLLIQRLNICQRFKSSQPVHLKTTLATQSFKLIITGY